MHKRITHTTFFTPTQLHSTAVWLVAFALRLGADGLMPVVLKCSKATVLSPNSDLAQAEISYSVCAVRLPTKGKEKSRGYRLIPLGKTLQRSQAG